MKLFVASLPADFDETDFREMFELYGEVTSAKLITDRATGKSKGFGFIDMPDKLEAQSTIEALNGAKIKGKKLSVMEADESRKGPGGPGGGGGGFNRDRGGYGGDRGGLRAYNFENGYMVGADTVAGNKANLTKKVPLTVPVYNWEWDMELFSTLPYKKVGQQFAIAFLDPNDDKPAYYTHTITAVDELALNKQVKVKCWVLRVGYNATSYADFWISQQSHEMLKMKEYFRGKYRFKVKLY